MLGVPLEDSLGFDLTTLHTAALLAALELLDDELLPDEQAASARAPAISPAMSFRLRARRTLISSSSLHVAPVGQESQWHGLPPGRGSEGRYRPVGRKNERRTRSVTESCPEITGFSANTTRYCRIDDRLRQFIRLDDGTRRRAVALRNPTRCRTALPAVARPCPGATLRMPGGRRCGCPEGDVAPERVARRPAAWARHGIPTTDINVTSDPVATNISRGLASLKIAVWWPGGRAAVSAAASQHAPPYAGG